MGLKAGGTEAWKGHYSKKRTARIQQSLKTDCWKLIEHFEELLLHACPVLMHFLRHLLLVTVSKVDGLVQRASCYTWKAFLKNGTKYTVANIINGLWS